MSEIKGLVSDTINKLVESQKSKKWTTNYSNTVTLTNTSFKDENKSMMVLSCKVRVGIHAPATPKYLNLTILLSVNPDQPPSQVMLFKT